MTSQPQPTVQGTYRVKVFGTDKSSYWRYVADNTPWIQLATLEETNNLFQWNITPVRGQADTFTIVPGSNINVGMINSTNNPQKFWGYGFPIGNRGASARWIIKKKSSSDPFSKVYCEGTPYAVDARDTSSDKAVHFYADQDGDNAKNQRWVFEPVSNNPTPVTPESTKTFEKLFFTLTPERAATETYDIIIIGTGIGGGIIAGDLFDTNSRLGGSAKSVLVIEKGDLPFHSHCLNASRPTGFGEDRGQQNDTFFALFRDNYKLSPPDNKQWKGGPMYNLGGRSAAWGLFIPRIHDDVLKAEFAPGSQLYNSLVRTWYKEAETLMSLSLPTTTTTHQNLMERLNIRCQRRCQWQWGRIASEFREQNNFDFATGAYSTIDKLLEIAMSKQRKADGTTVEHPNWKILLRTDVRSITWDTNDDSQATGVVVRGADGRETTIRLKTNASGRVLESAKVVLAAGSVGSPAILMRSGKTEFLRNNGGLHLTDHDIFAKAYTFQYRNPGDRERIGSMKLQTHVALQSGTLALVNMSIDASSFLPREFLPGRFFRNENFPKLIVACILPTGLNFLNTITLDSDKEPVVTIDRASPFNNTIPDVGELRKLTLGAVAEIREALSIEVRGLEDDEEATFFKPLELGGVAHELGTIPFRGAGNDRFCLDDDLKLRNHKGIYVCDLSVFPYSPEVNPTLTLAALALRLSRMVVLPRLPVFAKSPEAVYVINQTGENIQVFVSNRAGVPLTAADGLETLTPGKLISRRRKLGIAESVFVYRLDFNSSDTYLPEPTLFVANPGEILAI